MPRTKGTKSQSRLTFAPIEETSPSPYGRDSPLSSSALSPSKLRYSNPSPRKLTVKGQLQLKDCVRSWGNTGRSLSNDDWSNEAGQILGSEVDLKQKHTKKSNQLHSNLSTPPHRTSTTLNNSISSDDDEVIRPSKRRRLQSGVLSDNENDLNPQFLSNSERNSKSSSDDEINIIETDMPRRRSQRLNASSLPEGTPPRKRSLKIDLSELGDAEESSTEELPSSPGTYRKRRGLVHQERIPSVADPDDSDVVIVGHKQKKRKSVVKTDTEEPRFSEPRSDEGSADDDIMAFTPSRRNLKRSQQFSSGGNVRMEAPKTPNKLHSEQDELDLEEDLEYLKDSDLREKRTRGTAVNSARSTRQKHLEMLRRRRAGEKITSDPPDIKEEEDDDDEPQQYPSSALFSLNNFFGRKLETYKEDTDEDSDAESVVEADEDLDADDSSFVEDDGDLGVPVNVPFEFSRHRTKSTRDCFRDVVEWMVHSKLNPAFRRNDEMYQFAFTKVGDEVVGRAGSQLMSSVWNADFRNALCARPYLDVTPFLASEGYSCAACNRSGHLATSDLKFTGKPYSDETLEPLYESDSDSDSDEEDEEGDADSDSDNDNEVVGSRRDRDRDGHVLPPEGKHYYLGKTCKSNAVLTHTLIHWRFHLYEWVIDYLNRTEELLSNPERSLEREKLSAKKRTKYANKVVEKMDKDGEVQKLWKDFHRNIRTVREMKNNNED